MKAMLAALGVLCMVTMSLSAGVDEGVNEEPLEAPAPDDALAQALQRYITGPEMLLRHARSEGEAERMDRVLRAGLDPDARLQAGQTLLHVVAAEGRAASASVLLRWNADPNARDPDGATPLHAAAGACSLQVIDLLLGAGADVNARNDAGRTPLHEAAGAERAWAVIALLEAGADPYAVAERGTNALHIAALAGQSETAEVLAEAGLQHDVFTLAALDRAEQLRELLRADPEQIEAVLDVGPPLFWAASTGAPDAARALLDAGADPNSRHFTFSPLHVAVMGDHTSVAAVLLARGAEAGAEMRGGFRPLHFASSAEMCRLLLDAGADPNVPSAEGQRPLHVQAADGCDRLVRALLDAGAEVDAPDAVGRTALSWAVDFGHLVVVRRLLERGADPNARMGDGKVDSALHFSVGPGRFHGAGIPVSLLEAGADVDIRNAVDMTPLHVAALVGSEEGVKLLLGAGADPSAVDTFGRTPLDIARRHGGARLSAFIERAVEAR